MRTTIDRAGRLVVPKELRDRLGLTGGEEVDIRERDGRLEIVRVGPEVTVDRTGRKPVLRVTASVATLTNDDVRDLIERGRR